MLFRHRGISPAALPKVGRYIIKLPPTDYHLTRVGRVNRDRTFVRSVANDILATCINVDLVADEGTML